MPPVNISFLTATDLGTLPADITQSDIHDGGVNYDVYYKFTAPVGAEEIGAWGFTTIADTFVTQIIPYVGPAASPTQILSIAAQNVPIQFPVEAGTEYFLKFAKQNNNSPASIRIRVEVAPNTAVVTGDICVPDDTEGFPMCVLDPATDYTIVRFVKNIVPGEQGCVLENGPICLENRYVATGGDVVFYDLNFLETSRYDFIKPGVELSIRACKGTNRFFVGSRELPFSRVKSFDRTGAVVGSWTLPTSSLFSLAANNNETILYYARFGVGEAIKRFDLVTSLAMADFAAGVANETVTSMLYMSDDTLITLHENLGANTCYAKRWQPDGTLLNTYNLVLNNGPFCLLAYAHATADTTFWVWTHDNDARSRFRNIRMSDGVVLIDRLSAEYEGGAMTANETATPLARFGNSYSCPFFIYPQGRDISGIYFLEPPDTPLDETSYTDKYYDVTRKIPNPTVRTALIGD